MSPVGSLSSPLPLTNNICMIIFLQQLPSGLVSLNDVNESCKNKHKTLNMQRPVGKTGLNLKGFV